MTPNTQALQRLLDAVEAGLPSPTNWRDFEAIPTGTNDTPGPILAHRAYYGSLDAFKALFAELLKGWKFNVRFAQHADGFYCEIAGPMPDDAQKWTYAPLYSGKASELSRAGLSAIIRAVMAGERE